MEITEKKLREILLKAFRTGQDSGNDYPVKFWVEEEILKLRPHLFVEDDIIARNSSGVKK